MGELSSRNDEAHLDQHLGSCNRSGDTARLYVALEFVDHGADLELVLCSDQSCPIAYWPRPGLLKGELATRLQGQAAQRSAGHDLAEHVVGEIELIGSQLDQDAVPAF
jgi:hypothetical protein